MNLFDQLTIVTIAIVIAILIGFISYIAVQYFTNIAGKDRSFAAVIGVILVVISIIGNAPNYIILMANKWLQINLPETELTWEDKLVLIIICSITVWAFYIYQKHRNKSVSDSSLQQSTKEFNDKRAYIVEKLEAQYAFRKSQKLDERIHLDLYFEGGDELSIHELFQQQICVFIIGEPGAGKTTQLLDLAVQLLKENKDIGPIPIILNLSTWSDKYSNLKDWIADYLDQAYAFPPKETLSLLNQGKIIPLLDGLDELGRHLERDLKRIQLRLKCYTSIIYFIKDTPAVKMIVSCRKEEFHELKKHIVKNKVKVSDLRVFEIQPITRNIIQEALQKNHGAFLQSNKNAQASLSALLNSNDWLSVLQIPFYFNIASKIFEDTIYPIPKIQTWPKKK